VIICFKDPTLATGRFIIVDSIGNIIKEGEWLDNGPNDISVTALTNGNIFIVCSSAAAYNHGKYVILNSEGDIIKGATTFNTGGVASIHNAVTTLPNGNVCVAYLRSQDGPGQYQFRTPSGDLIGSEQTFDSSEDDLGEVVVVGLPNGTAAICYKNEDDEQGQIVIVSPDSGIVTSDVFYSSNVSHLSATPFANGNLLIAFQSPDNAYHGKFAI
jgi:hypothetical protein